MSATGVEASEPRWWPEYPSPTPRREAKHRLAEQVRDVARGVSQLDVEGADEQRLSTLEARLAEVRDLLAELPDLSRHGGASSAPGDDGHLFERSPLTGRSNPLAAPLHLAFEGQRTVGHATYHEGYEGPPGTVHGGVVIAAFDDLLGVAQAAAGHSGMTGTLTVRLARPTPLHERIDYEGGVERVEGRKTMAWGRAEHAGELLAEAWGVFIAARGSV